MVLTVANVITGAAAATLAAEVAFTYDRLTERVPMRFDFAGSPVRYGPRFVLPLTFAAADVALLGGVAASAFAKQQAGATEAGAVIIAASTCFMAYAYHAIVRVATGKDSRLNVPQFMAGLGAVGAVTIASAVLSSRPI
jgi:hypothetical protein